MAYYEDIVIPEVRKRVKVIPAVFGFEGKELDLGQGQLAISTVGRLVDEADAPVLTPEGTMQYCGAGRPINVNVQDVLAVEIDGIAGAQILSWLGKFFDLQMEA